MRIEYLGVFCPYRPVHWKLWPLMFELGNGKSKWSITESFLEVGCSIGMCVYHRVIDLAKLLLQTISNNTLEIIKGNQTAWWKQVDPERFDKLHIWWRSWLLFQCCLMLSSWISWSILKYPEVSWSILKYPEVSWDSCMENKSCSML